MASLRSQRWRLGSHLGRLRVSMPPLLGVLGLKPRDGIG
jgi:hypothetical protein